MQVCTCIAFLGVQFKTYENVAQLDLPLLTAEHEKKPHDTRVVFYLAQTLDLVEDLPAALAMYQKRIDMGGWQQEVFEAHMRRVCAPVHCLFGHMLITNSAHSPLLSPAWHISMAPGHLRGLLMPHQDVPAHGGWQFRVHQLRPLGCHARQHS